MKKMMTVMVMVLATSMLLAAPTTAQAQERPEGFGLGLGYGTAVSGISGKYQMGDTALQGVLGCFGYACRGAGLSGDYLFNMPIFVDEGVVQLGWNLGGGAAIGFGERGWARDQYGRRYDRRTQFVLYGQFVAGLEIIFPDVPLDVVFEWRPSIRVVPPAWFHPFSGGAHVRFYFQ